MLSLASDEVALWDQMAGLAMPGMMALVKLNIDDELIITESKMEFATMGAAVYADHMVLQRRKRMSAQGAEKGVQP